jgi:hypothetical protein
MIKQISNGLVPVLKKIKKNGISKSHTISLKIGKMLNLIRVQQFILFWKLGFGMFEFDG